MIQRIQTIWLILAAACGFMLTQLPLFVGRLSNQIIKRLLATESLLLFAVSIGTALLAAACIFLFRNRNLQFKLTVTGVLLSIGLIALEVWQVEAFKTSNTLLKGSYYWGALLPMLMVVFFVLASRGIYKDERLVKSLNRLR
ncbi:MAG: DUF4293 domain-containing protein [Chitinophagaceae bacterium]